MANKPTICLAMMVKNESHCIVRALESIKPHIDYWVIVDTGSTDNTMDLIKETMGDIPGELHERPWVGFGPNRTEVHALCQGKADYHMVIDADETLKWDGKFPRLPKDIDEVVVYWGGLTDDSGFTQQRAFLLTDKKVWDWNGNVHHRLSADGWPDENGNCDMAVNAIIHHHADGHSWQDWIGKYRRRASIIEQDLVGNETSERYHSLGLCYLMVKNKIQEGLLNHKGTDAELDQKNRDFDHYRKRTVYAFQRCLELSDSPQEIYHALMEIAVNTEDTMLLMKAHEYRPERPDAIYKLARIYEAMGMPEASLNYFLWAQKIAQRNLSRDTVYHDVAIKHKVKNDIKRIRQKMKQMKEAA